MSDDAKYSEVFQQFDLNGDGSISMNELSVAVRTAGVNISDENLQSILKSADIDQSGGMDYQEFVRFMKLATDAQRSEAASIPARVKQVFDAAADGFDLVGPDELANLSPDRDGLTDHEAKILLDVGHLLQGRSVELGEFAELWSQAETSCCS